MKVLLVNLPYNSLNEYEVEYYPLGLLILQNAFARHGLDAEIIDLYILNKEGTICLDENFYSNTARYIYEKSPDYIGITSMSNNFINAVLLAEELKKILPHSKIFLGGPQVSYIAKETLEEYAFIDFVCRKESELILEDLCKYFCGEIGLESIPNVTYRYGNTIIENKDIGRLVSGDEIPAIDYTDYFNRYKGYISSRKTDMIDIEGGRGCPYNCIYCSTNEYWNRTFRLKSIDKLIDEIKYLNELFNIKWFNINHDLFTCNKSKLIEFCSKVKELGVTWTCSSRADVLDEQLILIMKESGCSHIFFGIETGDEGTQKYINKNLDLNNTDRIIKYCKDNKINATTSFIIGFPDETVQSINNTLEKILRYKIHGCERYLLNILIPEHGSVLMKKVNKLKFEKSLYLDNWSTISINQKKEIDMILKNPNLFNSFYYYESYNFNAFFLHTIKNVFVSLVQYFKYTLYIYVTQNNISIIDTIFKIMKWELSSQLSEYEYQKSKDKALIYKNMIEFINENNSDDILENVFSHEQDILNTIRESEGVHIVADSNEQIHFAAKVYKYDYNIAKVMYLIQHQNNINVTYNGLYIAMKKEQTKGDKVRISVITNEIFEYLKEKTKIDSRQFIDYMETKSVESVQKAKELIERGFFIGNTNLISKYIESKLKF